MPKTIARDIVLVVDDSPDTLRMLTDAIEDAGMTVLVAREGAQAISMIDKVTPDVILMDAVMPGMDGFETSRALKSDKGLAHVPVIFMTGLSEPEDVIKGLDAGGVDYVTKPIVPQELLARIRVHLANARLARSAQTALDVSGRFLLAVNRAGRVLWCTPQAATLLGAAMRGFSAKDYELPAPVRAWLAERLADAAAATADSIELTRGRAAEPLFLSYVGQVGTDEVLLRLTEGEAGSEVEVLRRKLMLTQREAEVLLWIARGKANRDVAEILDLSPRTVNKHLEQIFSKLGVENRTSAAAVAMRALSPQS
ncbi:MAG TPA: DNA-binding response regulator [Xanthobacteraceae bacterium]|nr:DNA-binding response regulator [Xanthobacteraceae bacterium]